jgi:predicted ATPase
MNTFVLRKKLTRTVRNVDLSAGTMKLKQITIQGFKSFDQEGATIRFGEVTVLLGANGVGKSIVVSFFKMLNFMAAGAFQTYVAEQGFANSLLHYGGNEHDQIGGKFELVDGNDQYFTSFTIAKVSSDHLMFSAEGLESIDEFGQSTSLGRTKSLTRETSFLQLSEDNDPEEEEEHYHPMTAFLGRCKVFHFHQTNAIAKIRGRSYIGDNHRLDHEAGNLGAFLYALKENPAYRWHYDRIVRQIKQAMPQFGDFDLHPDGANPNYIALNWRDNSLNPDYLFGPHQISDGSLRFMALTTLLMQPKELLPKVIVLDEPELGLHPSALAYLGGMIHLASQHCQVVIATQSQRLVDEFEVENIVILERDPKRNATVVSYKTEEELAGWLERYSLSELWEKNVIGGQP